MNLQKIWFPQIESRGSSDTPEPVLVALRKFFEIFGISTGGIFVSKNPLTSIHNTNQNTTSDLFNLSVLTNFLEEQKTKKTIWAFGTFSTEQVEKYSSQELGFNLFDLPGKIFKYIPLIPSPETGVNCFKQLLSFNIENVENQKIYSDTIELLKLSRCHKAALEIQKPYGHGLGHSQRDWLQTQSCQVIFDRLKRLKNDYEKEWSDLPCGKECQLLKRIAEMFEKFQGVKDKDKPCPELSRQIAFLDCRKYRMVQSRYFASLYKSTGNKRNEKFKKIIVLEDNEEFKKQLKKDLRRFVEYEKDIIEAHPGKSWENCCLCRKNGKDILAEIIDDNKIEPGEVLTCFDLELGKENIPKTAMGDFIKNIFGGHWILYKTGCVHPKIPRLVITGYRSQDLSSHIAGGSAFLMKPYTVDLLRKQIEKARQSVRRCVTWLCPKNVQENYSNLLDTSVLSFTKIKKSLKSWLDRNQVDLNIEGDAENIDNEKLVIIDIFELEPEPRHTSKITELREIISKIRAKNPDVQFILVLPFNLERETSVSDYYTHSPLNFHDRTDNVIRKPFWFVMEGKTNPDECLGNMILEQLEYKGNFDVKYQILVPLAPIVGRLPDRIIDRLNNPKQKPICQIYSSLLPYLVSSFGLSARISDIVESRNDSKNKFLERINDERENDEKRWENIDKTEVEKILDNFLEAIKNNQINGHINLESWLRHIVDTKSKTLRKDINTLTEPLARVFGGSTRYEFSVRGSWYKCAKRIDDILIVVEFCAKSSIIGRKFIRETAIKYLSKVAGEDVVLVQEIPIKGFLWE